MGMILNTFNRGEVSDAAQVREDVEKVRRSGSLMENWMALKQGPMIRRPGFQVIAALPTTGRRIYPFQYSADETALLEFGDSTLRIWLSGATLLARTAVTTAITNGGFGSGLTGWTDASGSGATVTASSGKAILTGADTEDAVLYQTLTTQTGAEHGLMVIVEEGPCRLKIGENGVNSTEITDSVLEPGKYSFAFTPSANITITLVNSNRYATKVNEVTIEGAGTVTLQTPVSLADLSTLKLTATAGRIFASWSGEMFLIERRGTKSWGVADFRADDGPFDTINIDEGLTLTPSGLAGNVTLTASKAHFKDPESVGTLRKLLSTGQTVSASVTAEDNGTNSIQVSGVGNTRKFSYTIGGSFSATVTLQRSTDDASWVDVDSWTAPRSATFDDGVDNAIYYYRLRVKAGDYTSGTVTLSMEYTGGGIEGICRITSVSSATVANVQVLQNFGATDATSLWYRTQWGDGDGHPNACRLYEGRLHLGGKSGFWSSVSDLFRSFDRSIEGPSKSIYKTIGVGPVDNVSWIAPAIRLGLATASDVIPVRSSSFGEALTQDNTNLRVGPQVGAASIEPDEAENALYFVQRSRRKLYELSYSGATDGFAPRDLTSLNPEIFSSDIEQIVIAREPDKRLFSVLADGAARILLFDKVEDVLGLHRLSINGGLIKQMTVLPDSPEDRVFAIVSHDGTEYLCRLAKMSEATTRPVDLYTNFAGPISTATGLSRFNGETVQAWAGSVLIGEFTVSGGSAVLGGTYSDVTVGLKITATYQSSRLGDYDRESSTIGVRKRVKALSLRLRNFWHGTLTVGRDAGHLTAIRKVANGAELVTTAIISSHDAPMDEFEGGFYADSRIYVKAEGPCTLDAIAFEFDDSESKARPAA